MSADSQLKILQDEEAQLSPKAIKARQAELLDKEYSEQFAERCGEALGAPPRRTLRTLQANITKLCNQVCQHCHVDSSPKRREMMSRENMEHCLRILAEVDELEILDITGGAPELHADFRFLASGGRGLGKEVIVRHNLTVSLDPHPLTGESMAYLPEYFAKEKLHIVSSLPYYQEFFTDKQRGEGVFKKSIEALQNLNALGFGKPDSELRLDLVYNPIGPFLPADQKELQAQYKKHLLENFGIEFHELFVITNVPVHRFRERLIFDENYESYLEKLAAAFNPAAASEVMCRDMISVSHDGELYDCDFNQMLEFRREDKQLSSFSLQDWRKGSIAFASHCFACTAGAGSSCGGATA